VLVADPSQLGKEVGRRNYVSAFALDRLDYYGRAVLGRDRCLEDRLLDVTSDAPADALTRTQFEREANRICERYVRYIKSLRAETSPLCGSRRG
jgi:hypothetical protein